MCLRLSRCSLAKGSHVLRKSMLCYCISSNFVLSADTTGNSILGEKKKSGISGPEAAVGSNEAGAAVQPCGAVWYLCPHENSKVWSETLYLNTRPGTTALDVQKLFLPRAHHLIPSSERTNSLLTAKYTSKYLPWLFEAVHGNCLFWSQSGQFLQP